MKEGHMIDFAIQGIYPPSLQALIDGKVASRIRQKDSSLYGFSAEAQQCASEYMGWATLASQPPYPIEDIQAFADEQIAAGLQTVILIGQGGSTQAPMTMTKYNKPDSQLVSFKTLDSVSPVRVRTILAECDPKKTLIIQSSKSGGTIEPTLVMKAVRGVLAESLPVEEIPKHLVAITDPGSDLEKRATEEGWLKVFNGEATVGGRYSALSVFGLVPAALVGIKLADLMEAAREAEELCASDDIDNPAANLAAFLYDNYKNGRDKFSFFTPKRGRVLGLWIEQLVAESLGKNGFGILPNIEVDSLVLREDPKDRTVIAYTTKTDLWDDRQNFAHALEFLDPAIPRMNFKVMNVTDLAAHFIMWEYAIAMTGYLMGVCPFDQPDVAVAKREVLNILANGARQPEFVENGLAGVPIGNVEVHVSDALRPSLQGETLVQAMRALLDSIEPGDYFCLNAFLPFAGEGRREALEEIRHSMADIKGVASCLEIGPRYLHSTGQLHKGGPNKGVFLIISADEPRDIEIEDHRASSLGELAKAQASGDFSILSDRGRRCIQVHLADNSAVSIRALVKAFKEAVYA
jgi:glucose-6-phosphate isomerase